MKFQTLFSLKNKEKLKMSSAAVVITGSALRVKPTFHLILLHNLKCMYFHNLQMFLRQFIGIITLIYLLIC